MSFDFLIVYVGALTLGVFLGLTSRRDGVLGFAKKLSISGALGGAFTAFMSLVFFAPQGGVYEVLREVTLYVAGVGALLAAVGALVGSVLVAIWGE